MPSNKSNHKTFVPGAIELEQAALAWFARCNRGLTSEEETEFEEWLAAKPEHARMLNEFDGTWELLGRAGEAPAAVAAQPAGGLYRPRSQLVHIWVALTAIAAAFAVAYLGWWRPAHYSGDTVTEVGGLRTLRLPDGSIVTLNTDSAVSAVFSPDERRVRLERGEAHFAVAKNPARPFVVDVGGVLVRAVGTAFNVRLEPKTVAILVTEGSVRVDDSQSGRSLLVGGADSGGMRPTAPSKTPEYPVLSSGRKVVVARPNLAPPLAEPVESTVTLVSLTEIHRQMAWRERRLDFVSAPLADIIQEFNRYNRHKLVIGDPVLATRRFGGSFKPDDQEGFVRMLRESFDVDAEVSERQTVLRAGR
ncbi:MAG: hypothetical protein A3G75_01045 [Verrucomicrobia bacterium RIFCSPLOWO2_12_FULL_64_8]|nr:MAG: hypothetical protein A3G75_01045 [Verrucomicrobia bacterium RIFCSPLOWO2_12_FULL_64_8]